MPVMIQKGRAPALCLEHNGARQVLQDDSYDAQGAFLTIGLINNMPDTALEATEAQFSELIGDAAGDIPVRLALYSLPNIPRSDWAQHHLQNFYFGIDELWNSNCDAVIMTGTEPRRPNLRDEAYWPVLADVVDWAASNTTSTVFSCLAAHAAVFYNDGIDRHPLTDKRCGVFEFRRASEHPVTRDIKDVIRIPHSRWNEVREDALISCGYTVLAKSEEAGVDLFVKKKARSLFVHFQGHPEYSERTLLKEYRRDIGRFLRRERSTYPSMPLGYFDPEATKLLEDFQEIAVSNPREDMLTHFPEAMLAKRVQNTWHSSATSVYRNWIQYVAARKADKPALIPISIPKVSRKRSAA